MVNIIRKIRYLLYSKKLKRCGEHVVFCTGITFNQAKNIEIGNNVRIGPKSHLSGMGGIKIGDNVKLGPQVIIWSANHNYFKPEALPYDSTYIKKTVTIEDNVWIGARVSIVPGVKIGEGAVIAMGAVVCSDIPPCAVAGGNPAAIIKYRDIETYETLKNKNNYKNI